MIKYGLIEDVDLPDEHYDIINFNGSSSYIEDLLPIYKKCRQALKKVHLDLCIFLEKA